MASMVPAGLQGNADILFGNLHELYTFHSETFLKDLENCISTTELVALCFVQRVRNLRNCQRGNFINRITFHSEMSSSGCTRITVRIFHARRGCGRHSSTLTYFCKNARRNWVISCRSLRIYLSQYKESQSISCCSKTCSSSVTRERARRNFKRR